MEQIAEAKRELVWIGIDSLAGVAAGEIHALADGGEVRSYPVTDFAGLARTRTERDVHVLDARRHDERAQGGVKGSQHIPIHELGDREDEVSGGKVWVYCGTGYRPPSPPRSWPVPAARSCSSTTPTTRPRKPGWSSGPAERGRRAGRVAGFATRIDAGRLRHWFACLVFLVAALVLIRLVLSPSAVASARGGDPNSLVPGRRPAHHRVHR